MSLLTDIDERSREIFRRIVENYIATGDPTGSRTLAQSEGLGVSPATIRNVMSDLTDLGLLAAPHISAGRLPTQSGLRLFVDTMLEVGNITDTERRVMEQQAGAGTADEMLDRVASQLSGLTQSASLVVTTKTDAPLKHVEFVPIGGRQVLMVMVSEDGAVENRLVDRPVDLPVSSLTAAANYLNTRLRGRTMAAAQADILREIEERRSALDEMTSRLVKQGIATVVEGAAGRGPSLIVRGRAKLLEGQSAEDLDLMQQLFDDLEQKQDLIEVLQAASAGAGVRIFIGSENQLFSMSGSSVIVKPYSDGAGKVLGLVGVIGPTRLNYARIIPMVDYTADVVTRLLK